ncbi:MAG TPA: hypothetical protein PLO67_18400 [Saprospiraceae bacterium]|nr:hypothetical protein [Saprospiraceae bacterium]HPI07964.1 hypothetical protein [Saprospiraceae bacterium]
MSNRDNLLGVFSTMYRWRKAIRNICLITLIGSIGITLLMDNYYQGTTIFYPASPELANPELIFGYTSKVTEYFGSDRDLDRMVEIAESNEVVDYMVTKFRLYDHYDIDSTSKQGPYKVRKHFRKLYSVLKNKNDAVELSIEDTDAQLAADMANAARDKINAIGQRLIKSSQATLLATFQDNMTRKKRELTILADSLNYVKKFYNIYDAGSQGGQLAENLTKAESEVIRGNARLEVLENNPLIPQDTIQYIKANVRAYERELSRLTSPSVKDDRLNLERFNEGLPQVSTLSDLHFQGRKQLSYDLERYNQILAAYQTDIPSLQLVEKAEIPRIKSRPGRTLIVLAAVVAAFFFSILAALIADAYKDINWAEIKGE